jgi:molybdopterin molybdotransferase
MKTIPDHLSPEEAWRHLSSIRPLGAELKPLAEALDHRIYEEISVPEDVPISPRSFMDGFALRSEDVSDLPARLQLIGEIRMGEMSPITLGPGQTVAIPTGGYLPLNADAVVMQEDTERNSDGTILVKKRLQPGENVQQRAEDFRKGSLLFSAGHRLRPQDLAALGTFGFGHVKVYRKPVVYVFSTGNELIDHTNPVCEKGKIRETNSMALAAAARKFGFWSIRGEIVQDEPQAQQTALEVALRQADVILISGGSSVGARDHTREVILSFPGHRIYFHGLAIRPGNPTIFASIDERSIFGLPGQPVSSLIVFYQFVLPLLYMLAGERLEMKNFNSEKFQHKTARLSGQIQPLKNKTDYVRVRLDERGRDCLAVPIYGKSASLSTLTSSDGFVVVPPGGTVVQEGTTLDVHLFP